MTPYLESGLGVREMDAGNSERIVVENETRHLGGDAINARLEDREGFAPDIILEFVGQITDGEFGGDLRDGNVGGFGRALRTYAATAAVTNTCRPSPPPLQNWNWLVESERSIMNPVPHQHTIPWLGKPATTIYRGLELTHVTPRRGDIATHIIKN